MNEPARKGDGIPREEQASAFTLRSSTPRHRPLVFRRWGPTNGFQIRAHLPTCPPHPQKRTKTTSESHGNSTATRRRERKRKAQTQKRKEKKNSKRALRCILLFRPDLLSASARERKVGAAGRASGTKGDSDRSAAAEPRLQDDYSPETTKTHSLTLREE